MKKYPKASAMQKIKNPRINRKVKTPFRARFFQRLLAANEMLKTPTSIIKAKAMYVANF
jgi:hypothetical protein